ncbi:MAG: GNAT family N-acetyltransferase [Eubacteriales bacterium]|nr:GNAT family N-acetyltransferase [Eubacteriales bacterium]
MEIDFPRTTEGLKKLWREAFGDEEAFIDGFFKTAYAPDRCRCIVDGGETAAMLFWLDGTFRGEKFAYVYAVATGEPFRGRGLCRALMEDTHALLKQEGYAAALLYPAEAGLREMYRSLGYRDWGRSEEFTCTAAGTLPLRRVSPEEYGRLRRVLLPGDGLIQEGPSLAFLAESAQLWAGQDILLAASVEDDTLRAAEFLGDPRLAPAAVAALDCRSGFFRQGAAAMILPFKKNAVLPGYLGLVFD